MHEWKSLKRCTIYLRVWRVLCFLGCRVILPESGELGASRFCSPALKSAAKIQILFFVGKGVLVYEEKPVILLPLAVGASWDFPPVGPCSRSRFTTREFERLSLRLNEGLGSRRSGDHYRAY